MAQRAVSALAFFQLSATLKTHKLITHFNASVII